MSHTIFFDIETGPLPDSFLDMVAPEFEAPGNYKNPEAIAKNIDEQRAKWKSRAALSPLTGKVLCIGVLDLAGAFQTFDGDGDEAQLLNDFRAFVDLHQSANLAGFNIFGFDIPFITKRAWAKNVKPCIRPGFQFYRQDRFIDLRAIWQMGDKHAEGSLNAIAKFLGIGEKSGSGAEFARIWTEDRAAAIDYLQHDLILTRDVAQRMGSDW